MSQENSNLATHNSDNPSVYIGVGTVIRGSMDVPGEIIINGTFEGELKAAQVTVGKTGHVSGNTHANAVAVYGRIERKLIATKHLRVYATGSIAGDVMYCDIEVAKGGTLEGTLTRHDATHE